MNLRVGVNTMTGDDKQYTNSSSSDNDSQYQLSAQVVGKYKFDKNKDLSLKLGLSHTIYTNDG